MKSPQLHRMFVRKQHTAVSPISRLVKINMSGRLFATARLVGPVLVKRTNGAWEVFGTGIRVENGAFLAHLRRFIGAFMVRFKGLRGVGKVRPLIALLKRLSIDLSRFRPSREINTIGLRERSDSFYLSPALALFDAVAP